MDNGAFAGVSGGTVPAQTKYTHQFVFLRRKQNTETEKQVNNL